METIKLTKQQQGWVATFSDPCIAELFGSNTIPTAFTASAPASLVQREIQKLNPGCAVTINQL